MKKFPKILGIVLAASALVLTACSKKPVRTPDTANQTGANNINPEALAVPGEGTDLQQRNLTAEDLANADKSVVDPVYFDFDRSAVSKKEQPKVEAAAKWLKDNPDKNLVLEGHCDWRGTAEYNLGLGDRRANAVKRYLEFLGIDAKRLETLSKGSTDAKHEGGEAVWSKDRRVDFLVLRKQQ